MSFFFFTWAHLWHQTTTGIPVALVFTFPQMLLMVIPSANTQQPGSLFLHVLVNMWHIQGLLAVVLELYFSDEYEASSEVENLVFISSFGFAFSYLLSIFPFLSVFSLIYSNFYIQEKLVLCQFYILRIAFFICGLSF